MQLRVDIDSHIAVYEQVTLQIMAWISCGKAKPGDMLPSLRELAQTADLNVNTVSKALRDLELQGMVKPRRGMGVFVTEDARSVARERCEGQTLELLRTARGLADEAELDWNGLLRRTKN